MTTNLDQNVQKKYSVSIVLLFRSELVMTRTGKLCFDCIYVEPVLGSPARPIGWSRPIWGSQRYTK